MKLKDKILPILSILISLSLVIVAAYFWDNGQQQLVVLTRKIAHQNRAIASLDVAPQLATLQAKITALTNQKPSTIILERSHNLSNIWFAVSDLLKQVNNLPLLRQTTPPTKTIALPPATAANWKSSLQATWTEIKDLVKIERHQIIADIPRVSSIRLEILHEQLRLNLEQIRWAAIHTEEDIYAMSILDAQNLLLNYFDTTDKFARQIQATLTELKKLDVHPSIQPTASQG